MDKDPKEKLKDAIEDIALYPIWLIILGVLMLFGIPFLAFATLLKALIN